MQQLLFQCTAEDTNYLPLLKPLLSGKANVSLNNVPPVAIAEIAITARSRGARQVVTSCAQTLKLLLPEIHNPKIDDFAGSIIDWAPAGATSTLEPLEFLIVNPVEHLVTVAHGRFLYERYLSKFLTPSRWLQVPTFQWFLFEPSKTEDLLNLFADATFIAVDIETIRDDPERTIACVGFSAVFIDANTKQFTITTVVIPFDSLYNIAVVRRLLGLSVPKVFQNGQYDNAYLLRFNCKTVNWLFDTFNLFHSWYSELPKRLDFITSFLVRKTQYWKYLAGVDGGSRFYEYNGRDCFNTAMSLLVLLTEMPAWAWTNYFQEFPVLFPNFLTGMTGIKIDPIAQARLANEVETSFNRERERLGVLVGCKDYNPGSPQQTQRLFEVLGSGDIKGTGKIPRDKVMSRHPLNKVILKRIEDYRTQRKAFSSYVGKEIAWNGRLFYQLNPGATVTGRNASSESFFWCGLNIQNIPTGEKGDIPVKDMFVADEGFHFGEADYSQAEARDTAYISGDEGLIEAVDDISRDFHGRNAAAFFGIDYGAIVASSFDEELGEAGEWVHKTVNRPIRNLSKRTNHGANYNMQAQMLLDTMGIENVLRAKKLLGLPDSFSLTAVTAFLLRRYDETYPVVRGSYYDKIKADIHSSSKLVGATGWTRYCFGDPSRNKLWMNAYAAHGSQSLNAMCLNKAYRRVFYEIALKEQQDFKLGPQIHDSILFQHRINRLDLAFKVKELMHFSLPVKDIFGITRNLSIPVDLKGGAARWSEVDTLRKTKVSENARAQATA